MISDSDDEDGIDGNLFSRKKAPEPVSKPHPVPQVKAEAKREVRPGEGRPPSAVPAKEKATKSDGAVKGVKQELKVVVNREHLLTSKPALAAPKSEPMDTLAAQPPKAKLKQQTPPQQSPSVTTAGKKRPPVAEVKEEEEESSSSEEEEDEDSSFDEEPNAQGLDEDESDYEGTASSEDDEFKVRRGSWRGRAGRPLVILVHLSWSQVKTTPKAAAKPKKQSPASAKSELSLVLNTTTCHSCQ